MAVCGGEWCVAGRFLPAVDRCEGGWCAGGSFIVAPVCERGGCEAVGPLYP